ncbi:cAMP-dependent protein kinase regulatory subunit [Schizosaccharomyces pombe]|uniref:cAMP-dependent protein kinase regulatory subunit n=1 Tax=Schizosaccharomyces pombe (strain 972 / ATCC 24843) TaxID=284812 RepID=KAPR_SCHPO|nr:cAMP-dependent protein kinase regulatory subunit Cgs1 [Schizosaccharomyces pombe]P36600.2 RecName: Full=cAMP-dependent protein kinase regulatory subunit; Short=PKA regulatory subunit [Schizosaccharomyces pombe 972h-]CAB16291.2 cAMP-dependent protein kinase regulatory subunit Cgs1 [Schizosaccharomyces pombe]|eukprot:NP_594274.1 cAMP-dependent protein kinase regulatory subunit Cgs1 [Schizosaccharomyces pombe]
MSFEEVYEELKALVDEQNPSDVLQFCYDFFGEKLKAERSVFRRGDTITESFSDGDESDFLSELNDMVAGPEAIGPDAKYVPELGGLKEMNVSYPQNYNLLRRQSVSTESMNPSAFALETKRTFPPKDPEDLKRLKRSVAGNFLFKNLDEEHYNEVLNAMTEKRIGEAGVAVIVQGAVGDYFYIVEQGEFDVYKRPELNITPEEVLSSGYGNYITTISPGEYFGELALMYNAPRAASVVSKTPNNVIYALDRTSFRRIVFENAYRQRMLYESLLEEVPILSSLDKYQRQKIADALQTVVYQAGSIVIRQGDIGNQFYLIEDGEAEVVKNGKGVVVTLTKGDYFGELALIHETVRNATVQAKTRLKLATFDKPTFNRLLGNAIDLMRNQPRARMGMDNEYGDQSLHRSPPSTKA